MKPQRNWQVLSAKLNKARHDNKIFIKSIMIRGVLFDMDGVLVDSEEYICKAAILMFREHGLNVTPFDFKPFVGMGENRYIGGVANKYNLPVNIEHVKARTYEIYEQITRGVLSGLPGIHEFIGRCRKRQLKLAVATSADRIKLEINLREIDLPLETFDALINGLDIARKKPFPDIYIKAAQSIGLQPNECLVAEDAVSGVEAARAAGCRCLALTTSFSKEELKKADWICESLASAPEDAIEW